MYRNPAALMPERTVELHEDRVFMKHWMIVKRASLTKWFVLDHERREAELHVNFISDRAQYIDQALFLLEKLETRGVQHLSHTLLEVRRQEGDSPDAITYMVINYRGGPSLQEALNLSAKLGNGAASHKTSVRLLLGILECIEAVNVAGHVLRSFDFSTFRFDPSTRRVYLDDVSSVVSDHEKLFAAPPGSAGITRLRRNAKFVEEDVKNGRTSRGWHGRWRYAPVSAHRDPTHVMNELDSIEVFFYMMLELFTGHLPWPDMPDEMERSELLAVIAVKKDDLINNSRSPLRHGLPKPLINYLHILMHARKHHAKKRFADKLKLEKKTRARKGQVGPDEKKELLLDIKKNSRSLNAIDEGNIDYTMLADCVRNTFVHSMFNAVDWEASYDFERPPDPGAESRLFQLLNQIDFLKIPLETVRLQKCLEDTSLELLKADEMAKIIEEDRLEMEAKKARKEKAVNRKKVKKEIEQWLEENDTFESGSEAWASEEKSTDSEEEVPKKRRLRKRKKAVSSENDEKENAADSLDKDEEAMKEQTKPPQEDAQRAVGGKDPRQKPKEPVAENLKFDFGF